MICAPLRDNPVAFIRPRCQMGSFSTNEFKSGLKIILENDPYSIVETDPGLRGDTATGGAKPAKLETGAVVRVPLFINEGETIRVDTRTSEYLSRGKA